MTSSRSRRPLLGLLAVSVLSCGFIFALARIKERNSQSDSADLVWEEPGLALQASFSGDGRSITILGNLCVQSDAKTGLQQHCWLTSSAGTTSSNHIQPIPELGSLSTPFTTKATLNETQITPDGASLIILETERVPNPTEDEIYATRPANTITNHIGTISMPFLERKYLCSYNTRTGKLEWKKRLPSHDNYYSYDALHLRRTSNQHIVVNMEAWRPEVNTWGGHSRGQPMLQVYTRVKGQFEKSFISPVQIEGDEQGTYTFDQNANLLYKKERTWQEVEALELVSPQKPSRTHSFKLPERFRSNDEWAPLEFSRDERFLAGARDAGLILLWNTQGKLLWKDTPANFLTNALAFSPDDHYIAVGGADLNSGGSPLDRLLVYEVATGKIAKEFSEANWLDQVQRPTSKWTKSKMNGFSNPVETLTWSPDSRLLGATYGASGFKLWKVR